MTDIASVLTRSVQDTPSAPVTAKQNGDGDQDQFSQALNQAGGSTQKQSGKGNGNDDTGTAADGKATSADDAQTTAQDTPQTAAGALNSAYKKLAALTQGQLPSSTAAGDTSTQAAAGQATLTQGTQDMQVAADATTGSSAQVSTSDAAVTADETAVVADDPLAALLALKAAAQPATAAAGAKDKDADDKTDADAADTPAAGADATGKAADLLQMLTAGTIAAAAAGQAQQPVSTKAGGDTAQVSTDAGTAVSDIAGFVSAKQDTQADDAAITVDADGQSAATTDDTQLFRLQKAGLVAQSVDIALKTGTDGKTETSTDPTDQTTPDTVSILDSRRFLGLAQTGNTGMLVAAMSGDKDWAGAMSGATSVNLLDDGLAPTSNVVHTLKLQLNPDNLGTVTASMRLVGDDLSIHLTVHNSAAYRELTSGSSSIVDGLRSQGFSVDNISVSIASSSDGTSSNSNNSNSGTQNGSTQQQSAQTGQQGQQQNQQAWQRGTGDGSSGQQGRWTNSNGSQTEGRNEGVGEAVAGNSAASGSVYL